MRNRIAQPLGRAVAALVVGLCLVSAAGPAAAAKPPAGRTYFTAFTGIEEPYEVRTECLLFEEAALCSVDGQLCGLWLRQPNGGKQTGFSFELFSREDGDRTVLEGQARLDLRGARSSIAGVGRLSGPGRRQNVALAGREIGTARCLELLGEPPVDDPGDTVTESREVAGFTGVVLNTPGRVVIEHTGSESLQVTSDDNLLPFLTSEVRGGRLILDREPGFNLDTETVILFEVTLIELEELVVSGVGGVEATGIDTELFTVDLNGVATVATAGMADRQRVTVSGVSQYAARELESRVVDIDISGVSSATVRVSEELSGRVGSASTLNYIGDPAIDVIVEPGGQLIRIDD